jgi:hypothetical protein
LLADTLQLGSVEERDALNGKELAMMSRDDDESELLHRFSTRPNDQEAARKVVERLQGWMLLRVRQHWPRLLPAYEDIEARAMVRLVRLRNRGDLEKFESLEGLARQLVDAEAVQEQRTEGQMIDLRDLLLRRPVPPQSGPERQVIARELLGKVLELIGKLPVQHALVMQALVAETTGEGPPMERVLGVTRKVAKDRLRRARVALLEAATAAHLDEALTEFFESEG